MPNASQTTSDFKGDHLSVKMFGARGDGVTDDTAAIQAAVNQLDFNAQHSACITFPYGTYLISSEIVVPQLVGCSIRGIGMPTIIQQTSGQSIFHFATENSHTFELGGFILAYRSVQSSGDNSLAVNFDPATHLGQGFYNFTVERIVFHNCYRSIGCGQAGGGQNTLWGCQITDLVMNPSCTGALVYWQPPAPDGQPRCIFRNLYIHADNATETVFLATYVNELTIDNLEINNGNVVDAILLTNCSNVQIRGLHVENMDFTQPAVIASVLRCSQSNVNLLNANFTYSVSGAGSAVRLIRIDLGDVFRLSNIQANVVTLGAGSQTSLILSNATLTYLDDYVLNNLTTGPVQNYFPGESPAGLKTDNGVTNHFVMTGDLAVPGNTTLAGTCGVAGDLSLATLPTAGAIPFVAAPNGPLAQDTTALYWDIVNRVFQLGGYLRVSGTNASVIDPIANLQLLTDPVLAAARGIQIATDTSGDFVLNMWNGLAWVPLLTITPATGALLHSPATTNVLSLVTCGGAQPLTNKDLSDPSNTLPSVPLPNVGTPGTFGDSTHALQITVDVKGRVSAVSSFASDNVTVRAEQSSTLTVTTTPTNIPGLSITLTRSGAWLVTASLQGNYNAGDGALLGQLYDSTNSSAKTPTMYFGSYHTGTQTWIYTSFAGNETLVMQGWKQSGTGASAFVYSGVNSSWGTLTALWLHP